MANNTESSEDGDGPMEGHRIEPISDFRALKAKSILRKGLESY